MRWAACLLAAGALALGGCGGDGGELKVSAASSLKTAMDEYGAKFDEAQTRFSFAGSDELAAQIRKGAKPDVFASANARLPEALYEEGLVERPMTFAGNRLVLAVPSGAGGITALEDVEEPGTTLAIGSEGVPVGAYTRTVLANLTDAESSAILRNVRTEEPDVAGIVGKLTQGAVDAGFVYVSDVRATDGQLTAIELPGSLQPTVAYGVAVVKGTEQEDAARAFVDGLLDGDGQRALEAAGFEPPPAQ